MTSGDITTISLALFGSVITLLVNWAVLRGDHAGLKRIVLLSEAIRDLPEHSPGRRGLAITRDELAVRTALRMYPPDGSIADVLKSISRLFVAVSIGLFVLLLAYVVLSPPGENDPAVAILTGTSTAAAGIGYLFVRVRSVILRSRLSARDQSDLQVESDTST